MAPDIPGLFPVLLMALLIVSCGCLSASDERNVDTNPTPAETADNLSARAAAEMTGAGYRTAAALYEQAYALSLASGDAESVLTERNGMFLARRATIEFPFNRTEAETVMRQKVPEITESDMDQWLDRRAQTIRSDGEILYYESVAADFLYAHPDLLRPIGDRMVDFGYISRYPLATETSGGAIPYRRPVRYAGTEQLDLSANLLPENGTLCIWIPLPLETDSQRNVSVTNLSHEEYIAAGPVTDGQIGYVYYRIPAEILNGDPVISADVAFTSYEQVFEVDPARVGDYDMADPEYLLYTSSSRNVEVTDGVRELAESIVGDEMNPYLQARAIYWYIIENYPYSFVPHLSLDTVEPKVAESSYMLSTGHGDCGTQSMFFAALCRSLGIPARVTGGYQMLFAETPGSHFWAEYYIEGYGWIPCDTTVAEVADWVNVSAENRERFRAYYADGLDPARLVIQKDVDAPMDPAIPDDAVVFRLVLQSPTIVCDGAAVDIDLLAREYFTVDITAVE